MYIYGSCLGRLLYYSKRKLEVAELYDGDEAYESLGYANTKEEASKIIEDSNFINVSAKGDYIQSYLQKFEAALLCA